MNITELLDTLVEGTFIPANTLMNTRAAEAYAALKKLLLQRLERNAEGQFIFTQFEQQPETWRRRLTGVLMQIDADQDPTITQAALSFKTTLIHAPSMHDNLNLNKDGTQAIVQSPISGGNFHFYSSSTDREESSDSSQLKYILYDPNYFFTGREGLLQRIHELLLSKKTSSLTQILAITGLGGMGKTQVAVKYAHQYIEEYKYILWARGTGREILNSDFIDLANRLHLPQKEAKDHHETIASVKKWLNDHKNWLFILDDIGDVKIMRDFFPKHSAGHIILTTRECNIREIERKIEIQQMDEEEGALLLLRRARLLEPHDTLQKASIHDQLIAKSIAVEVGGLPLALNQAGAYIEETRCELAEYLKLYQNQTKFFELTKLPSNFSSDYSDTVATTWTISFQKVQDQNEAAAALLHLCAFMTPYAIPEEILMKGVAHLGGALGTTATDPIKWNAAMSVVQNYALVRRISETNTLSVHRLVHAIFRESMDLDMQKLWAERTIKAMNDAFPDGTYETWTECQRYLLHAQACASFVEKYQFIFLEAAQLLTKAGWYLRERSFYAEAKPLLQRALAIREQVLGDKHLDVAKSCNNLGQLYRLLGEYDQAKPLLQRALTIRKKRLKAGDPAIASTLHDLGHLQYFLGQYQDAEKSYQEALDIRQRILGSEHSDTATTINHLGQLYYGQGDYEKARYHYQTALSIKEKILAPNTPHPFIAAAHNGLGLVYYAQGDYQEAEKQFKFALSIREQTLGPEHHLTTITLNHLGILYQSLGKYDEAEGLHHSVLMIRERALGPQHPDCAFALNDLAHLYSLQERYAEAEELYQRALTIKEQKLGPEHLEVADICSNLAHLYQKRGKEDYPLAEKFYDRALKIIKKKLGFGHPRTAIIRNNQAHLYEEMLIAYEQAIRLDPNDAQAYKRKGDALHNLHRFDAALVAYNQAVKLAPKDKFFLKSKGDALHSLQHFEEALIIYNQSIDLDPSYDYAYKSKGDALNSLRRFEEALIVYNQSIDINPSNPYAYKSRGDTYKLMGRDQEAHLSYEEARQHGYNDEDI